MKTKIKLLLSPILLLSLIGCGNKNQSSSTMSTLESSLSSEETTSEEPIDYGRVSFVNMTVCNQWDGVRIEPIFTKPENCKNIKFTYVLDTEDYVEYDDEDDKLYFLDVGTTKIIAKSEQFDDVTFFVNSVSNFSNTSFTTSATRKTAARTGALPGATLCLGDSFFEFWANKTGISQSFSAAFAGYFMYNIGISATQTCHWRCFNEKLIVPYEPKNVVLNIGINDIDDAAFGGIEAARNILSFIQDIHYSLPDTKVYWTTLTQCSGVFANKWDQYQLCNNYMKNISEAYDFGIIDLSGAYGSNYASYEQDGLHPNQAGYDLFKDLIMENVNPDTIE